jgi:vancomycin resistance protein VanW
MMSSVYKSMLRSLLRALLPFGARVEIRRLSNLPKRLCEARTLARSPIAPEQCDSFRHLLAEHRSALRRSARVDEKLQQGKERNVTLAASLIDRISIDPCQVFSYHHAVGRPSRLRGFRRGLELHGGRMDAGVGGGCCQVSNMLYWIALLSGMKITERHRHALDLFPDHQRTVPFGCGATVFYNYADLRFENPYPLPVLLRMQIQDGHLHGRLYARVDPGIRVEVREEGHRFFRNNGHWMRENRIHRRFLLGDGTVLLDQQVAVNRGRVLYNPTREGS